MEITITYCAVWNYQPRAAGLADDIQKTLHITPKLVPGSNGVYEISAGKETVFSKRNAGRFPENQEVIDQLRQHME